MIQEKPQACEGKRSWCYNYQICSARDLSPYSPFLVKVQNQEDVRTKEPEP